MECSMANDQIPKKLQFPSSNRANGGAVVWELVLGIYLELGPWALGICHGDLNQESTADHCQM